MVLDPTSICKFFPIKAMEKSDLIYLRWQYCIQLLLLARPVVISF
jgi:hypothetical protein